MRTSTLQVTGVCLAALCLAGLPSVACSRQETSSVPLSPPVVASADMVQVDLTGAHCAVELRDAVGWSAGFITFFCATDDEVDKPHLTKAERHAIVVVVRVPRAGAKAFADKYPAPRKDPAAGQGAVSL